MQVHLLQEINEELTYGVRDGDISGLGQSYHDALLLSAASGGFVPQTFYALSETKLAYGSLDGETHQERAYQARLLGREFADEFGAAPIHYLIQQALCFSNDKDSGHLPNEDPHRQELAVTFIAPILPLCLGRSPIDHLRALQNWDVRVWYTQLHEGCPAKEIYTNALVVTSINHDAGNYDQTNENIAVIDNRLMNEVVVGLSAAFPGIRVDESKGPLHTAVQIELMNRQLDEAAEDMKANKS